MVIKLSRAIPRILMGQIKLSNPCRIAILELKRISLLAALSVPKTFHVSDFTYRFVSYLHYDGEVLQTHR